MRRATTAVVAAGVAAGAGVLVARAAAARIAGGSDPVPYPVLMTEPEGEQTWVDRPDGTRLRVVTAGEGPVVVLAHGYGVTLVEWSLVWTRLLAAGYRVVAFDQRGHGRSTIGSDGVGTLQMAHDYLAVLEHADARDAILVGHSMGGFVAIAAVLEVPGVAERLAGLVLFATFAGDVLRGAPQNRAQIPLLRTGLLQRAAATPTIGTLFGASMCGDDPSPAMVRGFREVFLVQDHRPMLPILRAFSVEDRYDRLALVDVPTVVVCGTSDRTTPARHSHRLAAGIPGARLDLVPGCGHMLNWEAPESLVAAVVSLGR